MKRLTSVFLALILTFSLASPALAVSTSEYFTDIPSGAWYSEYIDICYESGLMNGVGNGRFDPDGTVTIGQAIMACARIHSFLTGGGTIPELPPEGVRGLVYFTDLDGNRVASFDDLEYWDFGDHVVPIRFIDEVTDRLRDEENPLDFIILVSLIDGEKRFMAEYIDIGMYVVFVPEDQYVGVGLGEEMTYLSFRADDYYGHWADSAYFYLDRAVLGLSGEEEDRFNEIGDAMWEEYPDYDTIFEDRESIFDEACPRMLLAGFLYLAIPDEFLTAINDVGALPEMDCEALRMLYNAGILSGVDDKGALDGMANLTRAQLAAVIARVVEPSLRLTLSY